MEYKIFNSLKKYKREKAARFHMPGHKANRKYFPIFKDAVYDITELSFSDCLENPDGVIAEAESDVAEILGAKRSFFVTDGSTCAIFSALYSAKKFGSKIIIGRNSHKSVYNACALLGIEPFILKPNDFDGVLLPPTPLDIEEAFKKEKESCGVLITSPDYYGNIAEYEQIRKICDKYGKLMIVDGAHGAYLKFDADNSLEASHVYYAGDFADIWVDGAHKTLPSLTQSAILNVNDERLIEGCLEGLNIFRTTSPSYPIMASIEYGVKFMAQNGAKLIDNIKRELALVKTRLSKRGVKIYGASTTLQLAIDFGGMGISPYLAQEELEKRKIYAEMNDGRYILFYITATTTSSQLSKLERAIKHIARVKSFKNTYEGAPDYVCGVKKFSYLTALSFSSNEVPLEKAIGKVSAQNIGITPPCFPLIIAGEVITKESVENLKKARYTFGVKEGAVKVIKIGGKA